MNWVNYFIVLSLPIVLSFLTAVLAVICYQSEFLTKKFLISLFLGLFFNVISVGLGVGLAIMEVISD